MGCCKTFDKKHNDPTYLIWYILGENSICIRITIYTILSVIFIVLHFNDIQKVPFVYILSKNLNKYFIWQYCCGEISVKFFDKSVNT